LNKSGDKDVKPFFELEEDHFKIGEDF